MVREYLVPQQKLRLVYRQNIQLYFVSILRQESTASIIAELDAFLEHLKAAQIRTADMDLSELSRLILNAGLRLTEVQQLDLLNLFVKYFQLLVDSHISANTKLDYLLLSQLNTKKLFAALNNIHFPQLKLNKEGKDLCEVFINSLQRASYLTE